MKKLLDWRESPKYIPADKREVRRESTKFRTLFNMKRRTVVDREDITYPQR